MLAIALAQYGHTCLHNKEVLTCPPVLGLLLKRTKDVDPVNVSI